MSDDPLSEMRQCRVTLRSDLDVSRQLVRGESMYVVHDPVSFQSHRLSVSDYGVISVLRDDIPLEQCFHNAVARGLLAESQEEEFYRFVSKLQILNLLSLPNHDSGSLYAKHQQREQAERKSKRLGFLFLTIPMANPDKFLERTIGWFQWLFTRWFLAIWFVSGLFATSLVLLRWNDFLEPLNGILATKNIAFMTVAFFALKVWHELGHGYACKYFGGRVPEMGSKMIVGMPLAYVDASSAWSFPRRSHRTIVMLGGMYFESLVAIPAAVIWALDSDSFIGSCAYQLVFMAGVATVFFNANPLMRFDGYFVLSDLLGMPNLRTRAKNEVFDVLRNRCLGLPRRSKVTSRKERVILLTYGVSSSLYMISAILSISYMLAKRFFLIGVGLAIFQLGTMFWQISTKLWKYLLYSEETEGVRFQSRAIAFGLAAGIPLLLLFCPIPGGVLVPGIVSADAESVVRARTPGIIRQISVLPGDSIAAGEVIAQLTNLDVTLGNQVASHQLSYAKLETARERLRDIAVAAKLQPQVLQRENEKRDAQREMDGLTIRSEIGGQVAKCLSMRKQGIYLKKGDVVATIVDGETLIRAWVDAKQLQASGVTVGSAARVRFSDVPGRNYWGIIRTIAPASATQFEDLTLTTLSDGEIPVNPVTGEIARTLFRVDIEVPRTLGNELVHNSRVSVKLKRQYESIGFWIVRRTRQFLNKLLLS